MTYKRSTSAIVFKMNDKYVIGYGSMQDIYSEDEYSQIEKLFIFLEDEKDETDIEKFLKENAIDYSIYKKCIEKKYITSNKYAINYSEQSVDYKNSLYVDCVYQHSEKALDNIKKSTLLNIGCGGIGNYLMYAYASFLPKRIIMMDGDEVSISNLNRQILFERTDVGQKKVDSIINHLKNRFPEVDYVGIPSFANYTLLKDVIQKYNDGNMIITISGDNSTTVNETTKVAAEFGIPCLNIGYLNDYSVIGPFFIPKKGACPFCADIGADYEENGYKELEEFNSKYKAPSSFMNSSMASAMAMSDILSYFAEDYENINSLNHRVGIGNLDFNIEKMELKRNEKCKICG